MEWNTLAALPFEHSSWPIRNAAALTVATCALAQVPEHIRHVLDLAGISPLIKIYDEIVIAVGSF